jgi:hypothetical protein
MKDLIGLFLVGLGASIFQRGFGMLSGELKNKFAAEMVKKLSKQLSRVDVNRTILKARDYEKTTKSEE